MQDAIENYIERNDITFELRAVNGDGETVVLYTSPTSFSDVADYATLADEAFENVVIRTEESRIDLINSIAADRWQDESY